MAGKKAGKHNAFFLTRECRRKPWSGIEAVKNQLKQAFYTSEFSLLVKQYLEAPMHAVSGNKAL